MPGRPGPAVKEVEWIRLQEGGWEGLWGVRGGWRGEECVFFAVQKLRLHANKHRVSQCHANINSPWQFLCMFDTVPAPLSLTIVKVASSEGCSFRFF